MRTATTKVRREVYREFERMCRERSRTPYAVLKDLLETWMRKERQLKELQSAPAAEVQDKRTWTGWHSGGGG